MNFILVSVGGAVGASMRYAISLIPVKSDFPIMTLMTNIIGAIAIGFITGIISEKENVSPNMALFWKTGVCGGFTTFSTFSLEALNLIENRSYALGGLYISLSVLFCIVGVYCGKRLFLMMQ